MFMSEGDALQIGDPAQTFEVQINYCPVYVLGRLMTLALSVTCIAYHLRGVYRSVGKAEFRQTVSNKPNSQYKD
jgi:hypothetical protein